jgi:hypothetical protein
MESTVLPDQKDDAAGMDELDALEVVEAEELQEGVAFHAFRFAIQAP